MSALCQNDRPHPNIDILFSVHKMAVVNTAKNRKIKFLINTHAYIFIPLPIFSIKIISDNGFLTLGVNALCLSLSGKTRYVS
jgi:hypothetical protein